MKKIAIAARYLSGHGGTETVLTTLLNNFKGSSHLVLCDPCESNDWMSKINSSVKIQVSKFTKFVNLVFFAFRIMTTREDVLIVLDTTTLKIAALLKRVFKLKFKLVSWIHFSVDNNPYVDSNALRLADYHLAISSGIKRQLIDLKIDPNKIFLIFNPIDKTSESYKRNEQNTLRLLYVGRIELDMQKNLRFLFKLVRKYGDVLVDIYGSGIDDLKAKKLAKLLGIDKNIIWHGWTNDVWKDSEAADALVLTSNFEGFPMVILESLSRGLPVLSANCPTGPEDIVIEEQNGFLFKPNDIDDAIKKVNELSDLRKISNDSIAHTIDKFYTSEYIKRFDLVMEEIGGI